MRYPEKGRMIRVSPELLAEFHDMRERAIQAEAAGQCRKWWLGDFPTAGEFLARLMCYYEQTRERRARAKKRRAARRREEQWEQTFVPTCYVHRGDGHYMMHPYSPENDKGRVSYA